MSNIQKYLLTLHYGEIEDMAVDRPDHVFDVVMQESVRKQMKTYGDSEPNREICGVLIGRVCWDSKGLFLYIEGQIEGKFADYQAASVTFTSQTWDYIHSEKEKHYPEHEIVGWYHTHPGFGIFLSAMDKFIHNNFFHLPWQVAYVYDPQSKKEGLFIHHGEDLIECTPIFTPSKDTNPTPTLSESNCTEKDDSAPPAPITETKEKQHPNFPLIIPKINIKYVFWIIIIVLILVAGIWAGGKVIQNNSGSIPPSKKPALEIKPSSAPPSPINSETNISPGDQREQSYSVSSEHVHITITVRQAPVCTSNEIHTTGGIHHEQN